MPGIIPPHTIERIRTASDIVDVIGGYFPLRRAGTNFVALCPFHREKSPSFNVNPQRQIFHCFGCHKGGDVFTFVREYENIPFIDAVRRLAERAGIPLEFENNPAAREARHLKDRLLEIHEGICQRWQNYLANDAGGQLARDYLLKRRVNPDGIQLFRLGCAPESWDDTVNWSRSKGYEPALMEQAGLILRKEGTDRYYDRFRGRLMFPICDEQGRVVGFSGRILAGDEKTAKYVNSPETPIFTKGRLFFGLDKSKRPLLDAGTAIVCEGQLDLIACFMAGVKNIVAPQGTALTADHARILKRYVKEVILCFDSDNAGQNAAIRSLDSLLAEELAIRVAVVPPPHDPDSFIREHGGPAFQALVDRAVGFFDFYLDRLCRTNDPASDRGRIAIVRAMAEAVNKTGNAVLVDSCVQKTAVRLGVRPDAVRTEFRRAGGRHDRPAPGQVEDLPAPEVAAAPSVPPTPHELQLVKLVLGSEEHLEWIAAHLDYAWLPSPVARRVIRARLSEPAESRSSPGALLGKFVDDPEAYGLVSSVLADAREILHPERQRSDVLIHLRNGSVGRQMTAVTQRLSQSGLPDAEHLRLLAEQQRLRELRKSPLVPLGEQPAPAEALPPLPPAPSISIPPAPAPGEYSLENYEPLPDELPQDPGPGPDYPDDLGGNYIPDPGDPFNP